MYDYTFHRIGPKAVEFYVETLQGHRVVRVFLDLPTPRLIAFNYNSTERLPAHLWLDEIETLLKKAKEVLGMKT